MSLSTAVSNTVPYISDKVETFSGVGASPPANFPQSQRRKVSTMSRKQRKAYLLPWVKYYKRVGLSNRSIAKRLPISHTTVNNWLKSI